MPWTQDQNGRQGRAELKDGYYVNLGIGIPTLVANFVPTDIEVWLQARTACSASARSRPTTRSTPTSSTPASRP
jgi:acyl CoA:acetate/3-ketoacid CoA transferase beta subunit